MHVILSCIIIMRQSIANICNPQIYRIISVFSNKENLGHNRRCLLISAGRQRGQAVGRRQHIVIQLV